MEPISDVHDRIKRYKDSQLAKMAGETSLPADVVELLHEALNTYRSRCFWNCFPSPDEGGVALVVKRLRDHGDLKAWHLAGEIRERMESVARTPSFSDPA